MAAYRGRSTWSLDDMWRRSLLIYLMILVATTPVALLSIFGQHYWSLDDRAASIVYWVSLSAAAAPPIIVGNVLVRSWDRSRFGISFVLFALGVVLSASVALHLYLAIAGAHLYERWGLHPFSGDAGIALLALPVVEGIICVVVLLIVGAKMVVASRPEDDTDAV